MSDQLALLAIEAHGNEQDGWETYRLFPTGITFEPNKEEHYYYLEMRKRFPSLPAFFFKWEDGGFAQILQLKDSKPLYELQPETVG